MLADRMDRASIAIHVVADVSDLGRSIGGKQILLRQASK